MSNILREVNISIQEVGGDSPHLKIILVSTNNKGAGCSDEDNTQDFVDIYNDLIEELSMYLESKMDRGVEVHEETTRTQDNKSITSVFKVPC